MKYKVGQKFIISNNTSYRGEIGTITEIQDGKVESIRIVWSEDLSSYLYSEDEIDIYLRDGDLRLHEISVIETILSYYD